MSIYTACGAAGFSLGLIAGGLLTQIGWRWTFLLPVPIALLVRVGASVLVTRDAPRKHKQTYDVPGAVSITAAMLLLVYTVVEAPTHGWASARTVGGFLVAALLIAAFVVIEKRTAQPLVRLSFLRNGTLIGAALIAAAILGTYLSFQFIGSRYLQATRGWSPLEMAMGFLPCGILIAAIAPRAGALLGRTGTRWMMFLGFVAYSAAYLLFLRLDADSGYAAVILPSMLLIGVAFSLSFTGANVAATSCIAPQEQGLAAGVLQTGYQIGAALVLAVVTATMAVPDNTQPTISAYRDGMWVIAGLSVATTLATLVAALRARAPSVAAVPAR